MSPKQACALAFAVTVLLLGGCASGGSPVKAVRTLAITMEPEKKTRGFEVRPLTQLDITLPPTQGEQVWQISFHDSRFVKQVTEITPATTPGGGAKVSFVTLVAGRVVRTRLRFLLLPRAGAREVAPLDEQEVVITMQ